MKKFALLFLAMGLFAYNVLGQKAIILTSSNMQIIPGIAHYNAAVLANFTPPKADTDYAWNYAGLMYLANADINYVSNPFITYTSSNQAIATTTQTEQLTSICEVAVNPVYDEDTLAIFQSGEYVPEQNFSLYNYFSNTNDSLNVPRQSDYCRINILNFPAGPKSVSTRSSKRTLNFNITVTSEGYKKASGSKYSYFTVKDTVMGWGTLRVPSPDKSSISYNVLLLKRKTVVIDSFYINKKIPNPIYLTALGIIQGEKTTTYEQFFYRAGFANPIISINYANDNTYTKPVAILYTTDSIKSGTEFEDKELANFTVFPNPTREAATCRFYKATAGTWKLMITNMLGQIIIKQDITGIGEQNLQIEEGKLEKQNIYAVSIVDETGNKFCTVKLNIL